jgi:hypothetical protein
VNVLLGSGNCTDILIAKFRNQSDNPCEDEQPREKEPVTVRMLEDTNYNETDIPERLIKMNEKRWIIYATRRHPFTGSALLSRVPRRRTT